ncbi:hypothetical protein [Streptomyces sp. NPDC021562]|uniref:hypothetical protein n=1 Tax=Streptomyces sp. NPDC021562 TaxID=3155121 RepID=UPI001047AB16
MSKPTSAGRRAGRAPCGARLPAASPARPRAAVGSFRPRRTAHDRLLLADGTWRHVETIRVRSLFG